MLPPLDIAIPGSQSWKEAEALEVPDTDRLSPTGENVDHIVQIKIACLSGITVERPFYRDNSSYDEADIPPDKVRAMVAIFRRGGALGSSGFSEPLSQSTSSMFADDPSSRYVAMWPTLCNDHSGPLEFEVPLRVSNRKVIEREEFEVLVFLTGHSERGEKIVAYPIGIGSLVVDGEHYPGTNTVDLRTKYISSRSGFPAMHVCTDQTMTQREFTRAPHSGLCPVITSKYRLDERGGGFIRMTVDLKRKRPIPQLPAKTTLFEEEGPWIGEKRGETSTEDVLFQRSSTEIRRNRKVEEEILLSQSPAQKLAVAMDDDEALQTQAAAEIVAKLKFPNRSPRYQRRMSRKNKKRHKKKAPVTETPANTAEEPERPRSSDLQYISGKKSKKENSSQQHSGKRLAGLESASLMSFDDGSLMQSLRPGRNPYNGHTGTKPPGELRGKNSMYHFNVNLASGLFASKMWKFTDYLMSNMTCGTLDQRSSDVSLMESALSLTATWNTFTDDERTSVACEKNPYAETDIDADSETDDEVSFLAGSADKPLDSFDGSLSSKGKQRQRAVNNESPTFWSEILDTAQHDLCPPDARAMGSLEPRTARRRWSKSRTNRG